jgi:hypothetical protein
VCSIRGVKHRHTIFLARVGPVHIPEEACQDTLWPSCVFEFGVICGSRRAFWCIRGAKCRRTMFHARWAPCGYHKKHVSTRYTELVFWHPCNIQVTQSVLVCSRCETSMHYFSCSGKHGADPLERAPRHVTLNLYFYIRCDVQVT